MKTLDRDTAVALLREVVAEAGPGACYVDPRDGRGTGECRYWHRTEPGCLVGRVLWRAGWRGFELNAIEATTPLQVDTNRHVLTDAQVQLWQRVSWEAREVLHVVQVVQDKGRPWGQCLERAGVELPLLAKVS